MLAEVWCFLVEKARQGDLKRFDIGLEHGCQSAVLVAASIVAGAVSLQIYCLQ